MFVNNAEMKLPLEEVPPISQNITSFEKICIRFAFLFFLCKLYKTELAIGVARLGKENFGQNMLASARILLFRSGFSY
jgi:hypothetical protein